MTIYSDYGDACSGDSRTQPLTLYIGIFFLTIMLLCGSVGASGSDIQKQTQTIEKKKYNDKYSDDPVNLTRELREVREQYPLLAERLGLVHRVGFRLPLLCIGGVDVQCHQNTQQSCIDGVPGNKPDYQYCLDLANRVCCEPAVFTLEP